MKINQSTDNKTVSPLKYDNVAHQYEIIRLLDSVFCESDQEVRSVETAEKNNHYDVDDLLYGFSLMKDRYMQQLQEYQLEAEKLNELNRSLTRENERLTQELEIRQAEYDSISNAFFWKATAPLRKFVAMLLPAMATVAYLPGIKQILKLFAKICKKLSPGLYDRVFLKWEERFRWFHNRKILKNTILWGGEKKRVFEQAPLVSVIVPNYNHEAYLRERLESVYNQTYSNFEVILLDDCSTDHSRAILMEYADRYPEKTTVLFNEENGGKVFKQWNKGIHCAKGDYIWIAESDDWCDTNFIEEMVPLFEYESVMLAFARTEFVQDGTCILTTEEYLGDVTELDFRAPFTLSAHKAVEVGFYRKNMVPNVSGAMFRNTGVIPSEITEIWNDIRLCGDWLFYLSKIRGGCISYTNQTTNYYRIHEKSTSLAIQKDVTYYKEQEVISKFISRNYDVDLNCFETVLKGLEQHHQRVHQTNDVNVVHENYSLKRIADEAKYRKPNVMMCTGYLQMGGGETYPIFLANEMKKQGFGVTLVNFGFKESQEKVHALIDPAVPVVNLTDNEALGDLIHQLGSEIVHSHHVGVDIALSDAIRTKSLDCKQVISLHGMYEAIDAADAKINFNTIKNTCNKFVYTADKNLSRVEELGFKERFDLVKIGNGLPRYEINPVDREALQIGEDDFVLCLVSRGVFAKGWIEAVEAVLKANETSERKIHLVLIGDGPARIKAEEYHSPMIHIMGEQTNIRDYFAMSDMGLLPSAFRGESFPLVVIDCLFSGRPVLASNIGEIQSQLTTDHGDLAGVVFDLHDWTIDVEELAALILELSKKEQMYHDALSHVSQAAEKFDITKIVQSYAKVYEEVLTENGAK